MAESLAPPGGGIDQGGGPPHGGSGDTYASRAGKSKTGRQKLNVLDIILDRNEKVLVSI